MPQSSLVTWLKSSNSQTEQSALGEDAKQKHVENGSTMPNSSNLENGVSESLNIDKRSASQNQSFGSSQQSLAPNVELRACTKDDITQLKHLTSTLLPIPYPDSFFREIIEDEVVNGITLLAMWHDDLSVKGKAKGRLVGAIRCRLLNNPFGSAKHDDSPMLYLSTLALLSPYRGHGIAIHMMNRVVRHAVEEYGITTIGAHVWEANTNGLQWYEKRGFHEVRREEGYYRRLDPQGAVVLQRDIGVKDLIGK